MEFLCDKLCASEVCALWIMCGVHELRGVCVRCVHCKGMCIVSGVCQCEVCAMFGLM